jgi:taurine transport system permease protein
MTNMTGDELNAKWPSDDETLEPTETQSTGWAMSLAQQAPGWLLGVATFLISIGAILGIWWVFAVLVDNSLLLPSPAATFQTFLDLAWGDRGQLSLWPNALISLQRVVVGWGLGVLAGVLVGIVMAMNRHIRALVDPVIELGRPIPPLAYAPLLVIWFGIGETSKTLLIFLTAFPVMVIATVAAIKGVDQSWKRAALSLGASYPYLTRRVILPASLPEILTAMRLASGLCWGSLVAAEIIAASSGLGWMILQASRFLDTETVFVGIIAIGTLAFLMDRVLRGIERVFVPWKGRR